jgi:hypothetical protein
MSPIDQESQYSSNIVEKITKNITEGWIFNEIIGLIRHRLEQETIDFIEYVNDSRNIKILDSYSMLEKELTKRSLSISEFIRKYCDISPTSIDNKRSSVLTDFAKRSPLLSILAKIDSIDKKDIVTANNENE